YFFEKSNNYKSSSLWSFYSMLRSTLLRQCDTYKPKKSKVLSSEIDKFITEA
ncbi:unnamed protein product, partial [Tenebrio molitor]